ncbi:MAG: hypothetical protein IKW99_03665 [Bacteroidales bacterium]|nr:hypothetical protein [Bacteroidales bacterium]
MIVTTMSPIEICKALNSDLPKLKIKANSCIPKVAKEIKKEGKYPAWKWVEYTHQDSRNKYLISFYAPTQSYAGKPQIQYIAFLDDDKERVVIRWGFWPYQKRLSDEPKKMNSISYYCSHFFIRYRERVWGGRDIPYNELLCRYFTRNNASIPLEMNEEIKRDYEKYGELANISFQQRDGVCFINHWCEGEEQSIGQKDSDAIAVVLYYTIITYSMLSDIQKKAIGEEGKKYITNYYNGIIKEATNDAIFRQINQSRL